MAAALRRLRPTVVQTHGEAGLFWGVPAARLARAPVVSLIYQTCEETALKTLATRAALRLPTQVIAGSRAAAEFTRERFLVSGEHLRTIHCGIEPVTPDVTSRPAQRQAEWPVLVTVGRLKGMLILGIRRLR